MVIRRSWLLSILMPAVAIAALMGAVLSLITRAPSRQAADASAVAATQVSALRPPPSVAAPPAPVIEATGYVEPAGGIANLSPQAEGVVSAVLVQPGDDVKAGDKIVQLDDRVARANVDMEQAAVGLAQAQLVEAQSNLADQQDQADRVERMFKTMPRLASSPDQLARREYAVATARAEVAKAQAVVDRATAGLSAARTALDMLTVRAPSDATVLRVNTHAGDYAARDATTPLVVLGQVHPLYVRVPIEAADLARFDPHQTAYAYPAGSQASQQKLRARLTLVHVDPTLVPRNALTGQGSPNGGDRVLGVVYALQSDTFRAYPGQSIEVSIDAPPSPNAPQ
jgi:multidrug efflux pump subunit AcrA (membrane-fusion protein)